MPDPVVDHEMTRAAYDVLADEYARLLPDLSAESDLDRAVLATFADLVRTAALGPVADLGCGTGRVAGHLHTLGVDVAGLDLSPAMVERARTAHPHLSFTVGSLTAVDLPDASCGGVLSWYSLLHLPPQQLPGAFAEFARLLAPGGHLLVGFHAGTGHRVISRAYGQAVDLDAWDVTLEQMADLASGAGLRVHTRLLRAPRGREKRPQASLIATKPEPA